MTGMMDTPPHDLTSAIAKVGVHDHLCLIYETQAEQFAAVIPYMRIGLGRNEKCIYVADDNTATTVIEAMKAADIDVDTKVQSGQLAIITKQDAYLKQGFFDPDWMIGFLKRSTDEAKAAGFAALRVTGEMTWMLGGDPGSERLMEYEAKLNYFFPENDALAICQYNRSRFSPEVIKDVISTHPLVIYGGMVCRNFYYIPPDDFLAEKQPETEITRLLANIRSRAELDEALRSSEERMRLFFERQLVGMAITSPDKGWIQVNDRLCKMLGYSREELTRLTWAEMTHPDDLASEVRQFERMLNGEIESYTLEKRLFRKDGNIVFTNLAVGCVRRSDGSVDYALALLEDSTERKQAEESVRQLNEELVAALNAAEAANREIEAFAYSVSHDLRAPLRHIDGFLGLLKKRIGPTLDEESERYMNTVSQAALRMAALIDDLLYFLRMRAVEMQCEQVSLGDLVLDVIRHSESETRGRAIDWRLGPLPVVTGDRSMLHIVLLNLISNALKFTRPRERSEIAITSIPGAATETVICVRDNGVGFDMRYVNKLFGVFQRLHGMEEFEGTGIGLANVRRIIERHGGRCWAEGKVDEGASFYFALPGHGEEP